MPPPVNLLIEENTAFVAVPIEHGAAKFQERWWVKHCCMSVPGGGVLKDSVVATTWPQARDQQPCGCCTS